MARTPGSPTAPRVVEPGLPAHDPNANERPKRDDDCEEHLPGEPLCQGRSWSASPVVARHTRGGYRRPPAKCTWGWRWCTQATRPHMPRSARWLHRVHRDPRTQRTRLKVLRAGRVGTTSRTGPPSPNVYHAGPSPREPRREPDQLGLRRGWLRRLRLRRWSVSGSGRRGRGRSWR